MSRFRLQALAGLMLVLAVSQPLRAYTVYVSNNGESLTDPYGIQRLDYPQDTYTSNCTTGYSLSKPKDMAIGPDGLLYVCNRGGSNIVRFDAQTGAFVNVFAPGPRSAGIDPQVMEFGPDGNLYVGCIATNNVLRYNGTSGAYMGVFASGISKPAGMKFGQDGNLYVGSYNDGCVYKFDGVSGASLGTFASNVTTPEEIAFGPDGNLYVASFLDHAVYRFNGHTGAAMGRFADALQAYGLAFSPDGDLFVSSYNAQNGVRRFNGTTGELIGRIVTADGSYPEGGYLLITPEPGTLVLLIIGVTVLGRRRRAAI